jgi:hypothetical protein
MFIEFSLNSGGAKKKGARGCPATPLPWPYKIKLWKRILIIG